MLSRCANSQCSKPFLQLGDGKLFLMETGTVSEMSPTKISRSLYTRRQPGRVERYWLCDQCSQLWTLIRGTDQQIEFFPLPNRARTTSLRD
jgi:hypothetical protein